MKAKRWGGLLAGVKAPAPNDYPLPLTAEQDEAIAILHAAIVHVRESGRTPSPTVLDLLRDFSKGTKPTRSRGDRERRMVAAVVHAHWPKPGSDFESAPLTDRGRRSATRPRATTATAFEVAAASLEKDGLHTTPTALRNLYDSKWAQDYVSDLRRAWERHTARKK